MRYFAALNVIAHSAWLQTQKENRLVWFPGALLGAACVTWGVFSPAAGALVVTSMLSSKVGRFGTMISGIFCGAEAGRTIGRCYDQAGSKKLTCRACGMTFSPL